MTGEEIREKYGLSLTEASKLYDVARITLYKRRLKYFPKKKRCPVDGIMRFEQEEVDLLLDFRERGKD